MRRQDFPNWRGAVGSELIGLIGRSPGRVVAVVKLMADEAKIYLLALR